MDLNESWVRLGSKFKKTSGTSGFKGQKNIFSVHRFPQWISMEVGHGWGQSSKKHQFLPGSKFKTVIYIFLHPDMTPKIESKGIQ